MSEKKMKLSPPWLTFYREVNAMFGEDPDIRVEFDEEENTIKMYVEGPEKADALTQILPTEKNFGGVTVYLEVIPANKEMKKIDLYKKAFEGNPIFSYAVSVGGISSNDYNFLILRHRICQFWNDNLGDINGNTSKLYEDVARDIFEDDSILWCTDTPENLGKPI